MRWVIVLVMAVGLLAAADSARAEVVWLCEPGVAPNPCDEGLETTVEAEGRVETPARPDAPPVDCFYVYPTVSEQLGVNADKEKEDAQVFIARYQAARFALQCRVFAPMYRQLTLASIYTGSTEARAEGRQLAYGDVREAWLEYLAKHNDGRGVVLIGHSQGTGMLRQLMRQEVDPKPEVRARLVSALLFGGNALVRTGTALGGDFANVPACTAPDQFGCMVAYSIFGADPPDNARFGKAPPEDTTGSGFPAGPEYEVACTNPASLDANATSTFTSLIRGERFPGVIGLVLTEQYGGPQPTAPTPWLQPADRYAGRCERVNGAHVLRVEPVGDARRLNPAPTPDWGLHISDVNLPLGDLVPLVGRQSAAYLKALPRPVAPGRPRLRLRVRRCRVRITGADRPLVAKVRVRGRVLRREPFRARLKRGGRVRAKVLLRDGRRARLVARARC